MREILARGTRPRWLSGVSKNHVRAPEGSKPETLQRKRKRSGGYRTSIEEKKCIEQEESIAKINIIFYNYYNSIRTESKGAEQNVYRERKRNIAIKKRNRKQRNAYDTYIRSATHRKK